MKAIYDRPRALSDGLAAIRTQFQLPGGFPPRWRRRQRPRRGRPLSDHVDRTAIPFVTLDPPSSTDLDQAFAIEQSGSDLILRYAIADIGWFVADGDPIDTEAWARGETIYMPDGKVSLYPAVLSEGAASLLPDGDKPAILFAVRVASDGAPSLDGAERAIIRSRAKLGYATVRPEDLPAGFNELSRRIAAAERRAARRASIRRSSRWSSRPDGSFALEFRPMSAAEQSNAALSLAANLAIADALYRHGTGLFRVMPEPDDWAIRRLRHSAKALGVDWPKTMSLEDRQRDLDPNDPKQAAFMLAIRRAGAHASYAPFRAGRAAVAFGDARDLCPCDRAAAAAGRPLRHEAALAVANGRAGAGRRDRGVRAAARRDEPRPMRRRGRSTARFSNSPRRSCWRAGSVRHSPAR